MSAYDEYYIDSAANKVKRYGEKLTNEEYYAVVNRAGVNDSYGQLARNILATAKEQKWEPLAYVSSYCRDRSKEEFMQVWGHLWLMLAVVSLLPHA